MFQPLFNYVLDKKNRVFQCDLSPEEFFAEDRKKERYFKVLLSPNGEFFTQEIYGYSVGGLLVVKNPLEPLDENLIEAATNFFKENYPPNMVLDYLRVVTNRVKKEKSKSKKSSKNKGRPKDVELRQIALWTIENREKGESISQTIKKAFNEFNPTQMYQSFNRSILRIRKETKEQWNNTKMTKINAVSFKTFAKKYLKS
jgi:hypothetical protein